MCPAPGYLFLSRGTGQYLALEPTAKRLALDSGFSRCARLVAGRPNGAPCGRRAGMPVAGRIARREGPRCQGLAEKLGTVAEAVFLYYKVYELFGAL